MKFGTIKTAGGIPATPGSKEELAPLLYKAQGEYQGCQNIDIWICVSLNNKNQQYVIYKMFI